MWNKTPLTTRLGIQYPIIQGPFGGGLSSVELAALVSNAGGLGSFGAHNLTSDELHDTIVKIREKTSAPFAINLWIDNEDVAVAKFTQADFDRHLTRLAPYFEMLNVEKPKYPGQFGQKFELQIEALLEAAPPVFSFVYGIPRSEILRACKSRGIVTVGTATNVEEAVALEEAGVDCVVATGMEAGGHRVSFLGRPEDSLFGTLALVQLARAKLKIPVIAAGGIANGRALAAMLILGADGAQIGTAFLACEESAISAVQREAMFSDEARKTVLTRIFTGRLARSIANRMTQELAEFGEDTAPYPIQSWLIGKMKHAAIAQNRHDLISLWAGQTTPLLKKRNAATLFSELVGEVELAIAQIQKPKC